ncbi:TPA: conjugal transfer protein TraJ [Klebsiella aerogenes]|nr:conjugal transfer protein TraJ [Klebsiella aerogenes]HCM6149518.1 conjugal transfer protein TraJ [Klebsiella aerogenes]
MFLGENLIINGRRWDFVLEKMTFQNVEFTIWKFCNLQRGAFLTSSHSRKLTSKVNEFKKSMRMFSDVKLETFALYCFGASHQVISEVLSIQKSTSKRRINRIYAELPVKSRDEVYYLVFASGVACQLFKILEELVRKRVNKLLNK